VTWVVPLASQADSAPFDASGGLVLYIAVDELGYLHAGSGASAPSAGRQDLGHVFELPLFVASPWCDPVVQDVQECVNVLPELLDFG
jgi:hypothetical protein